MRRVSFALVIAVGLGGVAPLAQAREAPPPAAPATEAVKPGKDDPDRIVCTREHVVGSNRPQKVCMTVAQRKALRDAADRPREPTRRPGSAATAGP